MQSISITTFLLAFHSLSVRSYEHNENPKHLKAEFAFTLYQRLAELENRTDLLVSPASISLALGLLQLGAKGNTSAQLEHALGYNPHGKIPFPLGKRVLVPGLLRDPRDVTLRTSNTLQRNKQPKMVGLPRDAYEAVCYKKVMALRSEGNPTIKAARGVPTLYKDGTNSSRETVAQLACALFIQTGMCLSPQFIRYAALWANDTVRHTNFSEPNRTAAQINEWIAANTGDGESNSLSLETIDSPLNQIAVVSTMYFKSSWQRKFTFTDTQPLTFTTTEGFTLKVPTMYLSAEVNYGEFLTGHLEWISMVELPYLGEDVSMFVILPTDKRASLAQIERHFTAKIFSVWSNSLRRTKMDIFLPRFRIQNYLDLKMVLPALGITDMFDPTVADFAGISEQGSLFISEAIHKAKIEVTEDGTKASGATAMVLLKRSRAPVFKADRPFNFLLRQASTGSILFIGRLTNPTE